MAEVVNVPEVSQPQSDITLQDLAYLYQVLIQANIPGRDAKFVSILQEKMRKVLNIKE